MSEEEKRIAEKAGLPVLGPELDEAARKWIYEMQEKLRLAPTLVDKMNWSIAIRFALDKATIGGVHETLKKLLDEISPQTGFIPGFIQEENQLVDNMTKLRITFVVTRLPKEVTV